MLEDAIEEKKREAQKEEEAQENFERFVKSIEESTD